MIDRSPKVDHLAVELHKHLVEAPAALAEPAHLVEALRTDITGERRPEPVPPYPHRLVAEVDAALEQQIFHVLQR